MRIRSHFRVRIVGNFFKSQSWPCFLKDDLIDFNRISRSRSIQSAILCYICVCPRLRSVIIFVVLFYRTGLATSPTATLSWPTCWWTRWEATPRPWCSSTSTPVRNTSVSLSILWGSPSASTSAKSERPPKKSQTPSRCLFQISNSLFVNTPQ